MTESSESQDSATPTATVMGGALAASSAAGILLASVDLLMAYAFDLPPSGLPIRGWKAFSLALAFFGSGALGLSFLSAWVLSKKRRGPGLRAARHAAVSLGLSSAYLLTLPVFGLGWIRPRLESVLAFVGLGAPLLVVALGLLLTSPGRSRAKVSPSDVTRLEQFMSSAAFGLPVLVLTAWLVRADLVGGYSRMALAAGAVVALGLWAWASHLFRTRWDGMVRMLMPIVFLVAIPALYFLPVRLSRHEAEPVETVATRSEIRGVCIGNILLEAISPSEEYRSGAG